MANELLDFVMSIVRDPEVAARFAANPEQALLEANLTNVTSADVNALIPVVSESLSV
ncbi:Rv0340 family IniB-related protein, partial [Mycolicibacterium fallax]